MTDPAYRLSRSEYNNFQKLRFFGLVAKVRDREGKHLQGYWLLTRRGNAFLRGTESVAVKVKTYRNHKNGESEEHRLISDFPVDKTEWFQRDYDFEVNENGAVFSTIQQQAFMMFAPTGHCNEIQINQ